MAEQSTIDQSRLGYLNSHKQTHTNGPQAGAIGVFFTRDPAGVQVDGAERQKHEQEQEEAKAKTVGALNNNPILIGVLRCGNVQLSGG